MGHPYEFSLTIVYFNEWCISAKKIKAMQCNICCVDAGLYMLYLQIVGSQFPSLGIDFIELQNVDSKLTQNRRVFSTVLFGVTCNADFKI